MASPAVAASTTSTETSSVTSHTVSQPAGIASGNLLLYGIKAGIANTEEMSWAAPGGYYIYAISRHFALIWREADGSEGADFEVLNLAPARSSHYAHRITGGEDPDTQPPEAGWAGPADYRGITLASTFGRAMAIAERSLEAASDDPGAWSWSGSAAWGALTVAVHPSGAAFPVVEDRAISQEGSGTTSHTVSLPSGIVSGELLIAAFQRGGTTDDISWPAGWTEFKTFSTGADRIALAYREADGTEGASITVTTTGSVFSSHAVLRVSAAEDPATQAPEASTGATGTSAAPDSDSLSPTGGSKKYLWLSIVGHNSDDSYPKADSEGQGSSTSPDPGALTPTGGAKDYLWLASAGIRDDNVASAAPTDYANLTTTSAFNAGIASAERSLNAASEDPGAFSWNGAGDEWEALTTAVHPTGGTTESISGTAAGTSTDTAAPTATASLTATGAGTSSDSVGSIILNLSGDHTSAGTSLDTATATLTVSLSGTSAGTSSDTANVTTKGKEQITATGAGTSTDSASAIAILSIAATGAGTSVDTGALTEAAPEVDLSPPFTATWVDPARTASWTDPARTATWD